MADMANIMLMVDVGGDSNLWLLLTLAEAEQVKDKQ